MKETKTRNPFSFEKPEDSSGFLLWQCTTLWQRHLNRILKALDLTHAQFVILASLLWFKNEGQQAHQVRLSQHSAMDTMMVSNIIKALELKKFVKKTPSTMDPRANTISITKKGSTLAQEAIKAVEDFDHKFFSVLGSEIKSCNKLLSQLGNQKDL